MKAAANIFCAPLEVARDQLGKVFAAKRAELFYLLLL